MKMEPKLLWILLSVLLCADACWEHERLALLQLKPFFNLQDDLYNWVELKASNCCEWDRVECDNSTGRVIGLSLDHTRFWSKAEHLYYLNASLFSAFKELKSLNLSRDQIAGFVEDEGFAKLSSKLGNLENLDLSENNLNDSILLSLSELSSLKHLNLAENMFRGTSHVFEPLSRLRNLETLDLSWNYLKKSILIDMGILSSLKSLYLKGNKFGGRVHLHELNNLTQLKILDLSYNKIESLQPLYQGNETQLRLTNLEVLDLSYNLFRNNTFAFPHGLSSLKSLDMTYNQLQGSIDIEELNDLINLKKLDLSGNQIESLGSSQDSGRQLKLTHLEELDLSRNLFNNSVFASLSGLSTLKSLLISDNRFRGSIDMKDLSAFTNLEELDMSGNELEEFVSHKGNTSLRKLKILHLEYVFQTNGSRTTMLELVEAFSSVKTFYLGGNYLDKNTATKEFHLSSNVEELFLDHSYLNSNILQSIGVFTSLKTLSLSGCGLSTLPDRGWCDLKNLQVLYINQNALQGVLPSCLGNLTSLCVLDISDNQFTGNLSPLAHLTSLRFLDLSRNKFQVPLSFVSLANLTDLKVLLSDENKLATEFQTSLPKFQLNIMSMSKCVTEHALIQALPKFLYYQHDLRYVDLSYNKFIGMVPFWLLENNTNLEELILSDNSFTGPLLLLQHPHPDLSSIDISNNKIQAQILANICSIFPHLEELSLSTNAFGGDIPLCLGGMRRLVSLDLSNNQLSGGVLEELSMSSSLEFLRLSNNNLSGNVVSIILNSSKFLSELYLDGNNFAGQRLDIDDVSTVDFPHSLNGIDLSNNCLSGELPRWIWNLSTLSTLDLSNNHFDGPIPMELCNLDVLEFLDLSENNLFGSIPSCFNPPSIKHVHLSKNRVSGPLTRALYNSSSLVTLDLRANNLTGSIPEWIGTLSSLNVLLLKANQLDGRIPVQLCKLDSLSIIDLSQNMLSGSIPSCLGDLTLGSRYGKSSIDDSYFGSSLEQQVPEYIGMELKVGLFLGHHYPASYMKEMVEFTTKSGSYKYEGYILENMFGIDLSCNNLSGQIPFELGNLSEIRSLNFSRNNLMGTIPASFSNLKQIESLDLSYNSLSGRIPFQLLELNSLAVFSVAYNNLSGSIPERKAQFGTFDESSYEGNPLLCGLPSHNNCSKADSSSVSTASDEEEEGGLLDKYVFYVSCLVSFIVMFLGTIAVLYINPRWRKAWFGLVEDCITYCRYSIVGDFVEMYIFRRVLRCFRRS